MNNLGERQLKLPRSPGIDGGPRAAHIVHASTIP
jgi:hypothetical protein